MMGNVIDFQKRKKSGAQNKSQAIAAPKPKKASVISRMVSKAFWLSLSSAVNGIFSVARALGVAITLLAKFILCVVTVLLAYAYFGSTSPDYHGMRQIALWYPVILGGCLAYKGFVFLLHKLTIHLSKTTNQRTWR